MMDRFLTWVERKNFISVRALMLYAAMWMSWQAFLEMTAFARVSKLDGTGLALVIAAVTAPVTALAGFVYNYYSSSRKGKE